VNSWRIILATVVIFGSGVLTGGLLVNYVERAHPEVRRPSIAPRPDRAVAPDLPLPLPQILNRQFVAQLDADLHLTPEQREKIGKIIADGQQRNRELWKLVSPQFRLVLQDVRQRIRAVLVPEQRKQFDALMKQLTPRRPPATTNAPDMSPPTNAPPVAPADVPPRGI
jgi:hypothetical protein